MQQRSRVFSVRLNASTSGDFAAPSEFRLFKAGANASTKGVFVFDEVAAANVMAAYAQRGVDLPIDLEHLSLDPELNAYDPDARGWFGLEVRNGELWAVNVRWNTDGSSRLQEKRQRYISPAFSIDKDGRIIDVLNVALVSMPATHNALALVAASTGAKTRMDPELIKKALGVVETADGEAALALLKDVIASAAGGEVAPEEKPEETPDPALAEMTAMTEAATPAQALSVIKGWKKSHDEAVAAANQVALSERKALAGKLVTLGAETPATAYVGEGESKRLADRLTSESIESLRARVAALSAAKKPAAVPPSKGTTAATEFSARDIEGARQLSIKLSAKIGSKVEVTPAEFVARKNAQVRTS